MVPRRTLLLVIAGLLCAAALFAIAVLLLGRFGPTEGRIVGTTAALAAIALLALPAIVLLEQQRWPRVALVNVAAATAAAVSAVIVIWWTGETQGQIATTAVVCAAATTQAAGLLARRRGSDPDVVGRLYPASLAAGAIVATMVVVLTWARIDSPGYGRVLGSFLVLDVLLVSLQPLLARLRPPCRHYVLRLTLSDGASPVAELDAPDAAAAAAQAIRAEERRGGHVTALRIVTPR